MAGRPPPSKSRLPIILGLGVAGGVGYYLYTAGGNPKVAKKEFEHDAARASSAVKSEIPGRAKEAKIEGETYARKAGAKFDSAVGEAKDRFDNVGRKVSQEAREAGSDIQKSIDQADRKVEAEASKAKGWFSGK
ncbi:MAG: hypothetical protein M1814_005484 [Vezdaea aestivalis]|nr:MAG: hypothetical protein M1814_005484 [Vezdaea aestivalis]